MKFNTYIPCDLLKPYISTLAIIESAEEKAYTILPDTGLIICFPYKINASLVDNTSEFLINSSGLTGLQDSYQVYQNVTGTGALLVCFKPGGAAAFFTQPIHEFFRESVLLDNFMSYSELLILAEQLGQAQTEPEKIRVVEQLLISRLNPGAPDKLILAALSLIQNSRGTIRIKHLVEQLNSSQSSLEKRFRAVVGASPKKFASIIRFKHIIENYHPQKSVLDVGYEAGFYDQAHFSKEFKSFTGEPPELFFSKL